MSRLLRSVAPSLLLATRSRLAMQIEMIAPRHQLNAYQRSEKKPGIRPQDRLLWACLSRIWRGWQDALVFVQPRTVIQWQRRRFRDLIRKMSKTNPL